MKPTVVKPDPISPERLPRREAWPPFDSICRRGSGSMQAVVRVARQPMVAVLLIVVFLYGAGVPMPPLPIVLVAALAIAWALGKRTPRHIEDDD